jgi:flagellar hook-basal body complex protein FliE
MIEALALKAAETAGLTTTLAGAVSTAQPPTQASPVRGASFDSVLGDVAMNAIDVVRAGEGAAISGMQGQASAQQVVSAVMSAERTLQLAVAVRDKVVQAYQEVTRMAI